MMKYVHRLLEDRITSLSKQFPVIVLNGARQAGKSTLLDHLFGTSMRRVEFDPVIDIENARQDPELFLSLNPPPIILDEIQYAPELLSVIKRIVDARRGENGLFYITGSQQFSVIKSISESLAGRAAVLELPPMSRKEIEGQPLPGLLVDMLLARDIPELVPATRQESSGLFRNMFKGGYPRTVTMDTNAAVAWFEGYLKTYVERDIRTLGDIGDLQQFTRFVKLCAQLTAREINYSQLGREIGVDPKTAKSWLSILTASYQWFELPAYSGNTTKRLSQKSKGYFSDSGFAAYLSSVFSPDALSSHPLLGQLFETYVVGEIKRSVQQLPAEPMMYHWRSFGGAEVDVVIERDGQFWPIEIKLMARPTLKNAKGLKEFEATYPQLQVPGRILISGGDRIFKLDEKTLVVPVGEL